MDVKERIELSRDVVGVGERLRLAREHGGFSQQIFAEQIGYTRRQLAAWEKGGSAPPIWALSAVRILCDIAPEWVLFGPGKIPQREALPLQLERLPRLLREVENITEAVGIEIPRSSIENLARMISRKDPDAETDAKRQVFETLKAISRGSN